MVLNGASGLTCVSCQAHLQVHYRRGHVIDGLSAKNGRLVALLLVALEGLLGGSNVTVKQLTG